MSFKTTVREWFRIGLKPTQTQFWAFFDSIWFKDELIPVDKIEGLQEVLNDKADGEALTIHLTDLAAHLTEFATKLDKGNYAGTADTLNVRDENLQAQINDVFYQASFYGIDSNLVHKIGAETIAGKKTLTDTPLLNSGTLEFMDSDLSGDVMKIYANTNKWQFSNTLGGKLLDVNNSQLELFKTNAIQANIIYSGLSASANYTLPDTSGTLALKSDISFLNIDEGNGIGFAPTRTAANYGNIGEGSLDLILSLAPSSTLGTTGSQSIGFGDENIVNGYSSIGGGIFNNYQADYSAGFGLSNTTGAGSQGLFVSGNRQNVTGLNITVVGQAANVINSTTLDWNVNKPLFVVGNGTITNADSNNTVLTRSNAFEVKQDGNAKVQKDIEIETLGNGVILKSPDNSRWRITIDNDGSLTTGKIQI
ncbi:MAG: hypothetical protein GZ087_03435 [Flavobacterium sp.]|nr:hypothetical protein [Flavobacterium sp.]